MEGHRFYYFPPWRKQFFFSSELLNERSLPLFYHPYSFVSRIAWRLWKNISWVRIFFQVKKEKLPSPFASVVKKLSIEGDFVQVNTGTKGPEQKMTMLFFRKNGNNLFVKAGNTSVAIELIKNEAKQLISLEGKLNLPKVLNQLHEPDMTVLVTEAFQASKMEETRLSEEVMSYIISVGQQKESFKVEGLTYCLAHGDCCPWNFIIDTKGDIVLIDWEHSKDYPIGYDLLTYIFQTAFLLTPAKFIMELVEENREHIKKYFMQWEEEDYIRYIKLFVDHKIEIEQAKGSTKLLQQWLKAKEQIKDL